MELFTFTEYLLTTLNTGRLSCDDALKQYERLLARSRECVKNGGFSQREEESALFAVCAWIDESILCSEWSGREKWSCAPLQRVHFGTTRAGEEFFQRLESLDENDGNLREVYAYCLALGFKGRFFRVENEEELKKIRMDSIGFLEGIAEPEIPGKLFPGAYDNKVRKGRGKRWFRFFSFSRVPFIFIPVIGFIALFFLYRYMLQKMAAGFIGIPF